MKLLFVYPPEIISKSLGVQVFFCFILDLTSIFFNFYLIFFIIF